MMTLQEGLISPPVMLLPRARGLYIFNIDACDKQVCAFLLQEQPNGPPNQSNIGQDGSHTPNVRTI